MRRKAARELRDWRRPPAGTVPQPWSEEALRACRRAARWLGFASIEEASLACWSDVMLIEAAAELERV